MKKGRTYQILKWPDLAACWLSIPPGNIAFPLM